MKTEHTIGLVVGLLLFFMLISQLSGYDSPIRQWKAVYQGADGQPFTVSGTTVGFGAQPSCPPTQDEGRAFLLDCYIK